MANVKHPNLVDIVDHSISHGVNKEILHLSTNKVISGRKLIIKNKEVIHFGNCNYLGLERHPAVKQAAIDAINQEGIRLTMSRSYVSSGYYVELEELLSEMYGGHVVVAPSSTMLHMSAIPVLMGRNDLVLLDQQVHASMTQAVQYTKSNGLKTKTVRHNRYDLLEDFIIRYQDEYEKVWYMLDGIYSMYGDAPDIEALVALLDKYPNFYLYVDDAHGCSWKGKHGRGYILDKVDLHEKMMMTVSLGKGFGVIGGVLVTKNPEHCRKVRTCGNTMIFSAPLSSGLLGAAIASAKIHLSDELTTLQEDLMDKIKYTNKLINQYHLPSVREEDSPIFFIGVGLPKAAYNLLDLLLKDGYLCNIGVFPAVSLKCAGIRFLATCHLTKQDIDGLMERLAYHLPRVMAAENFTFEDLAKAFKLPHFEELAQYHQFENIENQINAIQPDGKNMDVLGTTKIGETTALSDLKLSCYYSIDDLKNKEEWDKVMVSRGPYDVNSLAFYENAFSNNELAAHNWQFIYYVIRDENDKIILAAYFTEALWKEDLMAPASISQEFEKIRQTEDPNYLISKSISLGNQFCDGKPLYLNRDSKDWKAALELMLKKLWEEESKRDTELIVMRDMDMEETDISQFFIDKGFLMSEMPNMNIVENFDWETEEEFINTLGSRTRRHFRKEFVPFNDKSEATLMTAASDEELDRIYELYLNVKNVNLSLNTFPLPKKAFQLMFQDDRFEIMKMEIADPDNAGQQKIIAFFCGKLINNEYYGMYLGMDYDYLMTHATYRQVLYNCLKRAKALGAQKLFYGFSADIEKHKLGAITKGKVAFVQFKDDYKQVVIQNMSVQKLDKHY